MVYNTIMQHKYAILGGTFDHFHAGHKHFINSAFQKAEKVIIGLTTDEFSSAGRRNKPFAYSIEKYEARKKSLENFLTNNKHLKHSEIISINDPYGTTLSDGSIEAIFVTEHGLPNAEIINQKRVQLGLSKLAINHVDFLRGNDGEIISSTRIRKGEIDREGNSYLKLFKRTLRLPPRLRGELKIPLGSLYKNALDLEPLFGENHIIISVGDVITANIIKLGREPDVAIIDLKSGRKTFDDNSLPEPTLEAQNEAGSIDRTAVLVLRSAIDKALSDEHQVIKVTGEEDLLALPAILLAPLDSIALYGLPNKGVVAVCVNEKKKEEAKNLLQRFEVRL